MRNVKLSFLVFLAMGLLLFSGFNSASAIELRFAHFAAEGHPGDLAAKMFATAVQQRTGGAVKVTVYPANELGSPPEQLEQIKLGAIDMGLPTQGQLDKYSKKFGVVMLPFVYDDYPHAYRVLDGPFMSWAKPEIEKQGIVLLANWEWGFRNITNNKRPINSPDDMKGLKMRVPPEIQLQATMEALGAVTTKIAFPELYMSLKQGVADGQDNPLSVIYYFKLYEVQKYLALTHHVYNSMVHVISRDTWEKLTPEQQAIIREESVKAGDFMRITLQKEDGSLLKKLRDAGMVITTPDVAQFRALMQPAWDRIADYSGKQNVTEFLKMVDSVR
ncbi:MAG: TRAP transporter substrate-binding protein [Desulfobacterales bacterium]|jgi:tripartite ATP-independent transporter DctP family solute receptor